MRTAILFFVCLFLPFLLRAQTNMQGIHAEQIEYYKSLGLTSDQQLDSINQFVPIRKNPYKSPCTLNKIVFGYHPWWGGSTYLNYRWDLLSDICYFSYEVDTLNGNPLSTHSWSTTALIDSAQAHGVRVHLCVTLMDGHATFLTNATAKQTLITNLINLVQLRNADGVNIDFEAVPPTQKTNLTNFLIDLCNQMHTAIPGSMVSIAAPSVNWSGTFEIATLNSYLDLFVVMGYDYYYSGSAQAGPTAGLYSMTCGTYDNLSRSITYYLGAGASQGKLVLALPYYGREWHTVSNTIPSNTIPGTSSSRTYKFVRDNGAGYYSQANRRWETNSMTPYYVWTDGIWHQCFIDDDKSFGRRLDMINMRDIAGTGMWALGYDDGYPELWNMLESKMSTCASVPCTDTIYDLGGPGCNHFNNENFAYTIAPNGATGLSLIFSSFSLEQGYDSLWVYDGPNTSSPLIGGYSGTTAPGTITATGGTLTLEFYSDNATVRPGWQAIWTCSMDNVPPITSVNAGLWQTSDFTASFTDIDNVQVDKRFYQVLDFNGTEWRGNGNNGFFNDNFSLSVHPDWTNVSGSWSIFSGHLNQDDEALSNTNLYAMLNQTSGSSWLYHWQMNIGGTGVNRRAGIHFFCDRPDSSNRYNSYMVYYRADQDKVQIYKYIADVMYIQTDDDCIIDLGTWYDCKVIFDQQSGTITAFLNDQPVSSWTDPSPFLAGNSVSLRTGNCNVLYDDFEVFRSRGTSEIITIGNAGSDVRFQNPNPLTPSCRIVSIATDIHNNISSPYDLDINIDWSPPAGITLVNDGPAADIDTSSDPANLNANWNTATDTNSGISEYRISAGTAPGGSDIFSWQGAGLNNWGGQSGLSLTNGTLCYFNVKAINSAGLESPLTSSDGVLIDLLSGISSNDDQSSIWIYPNPFGDVISILISADHNVLSEAFLFDVYGRELAHISRSVSIDGKCLLRLSVEEMELKKGVYYIRVRAGEKQFGVYPVLHY